jgi:phage tail-like protein
VLEKDFAEAIVPRDMVVALCDANSIPTRVWSIGNAYPIKWNVSGFNSMKNEIAIESMEFAYNTLERKA